MRNIALAEERDGFSALVRLDEGDGRLPIGSGNIRTADVVTTVAVDVSLVNPEFQAVVHGVGQCAIAVVQLPHVAVVVGMNHLATALCIVFWIRGHPVGIRRRVVGHPVEPHLHVQSVGGCDKSL